MCANGNMHTEGTLTQTQHMCPSHINRQYQTLGQRGFRLILPFADERHQKFGFSWNSPSGFQTQVQVTWSPVFNHLSRHHFNKWSIIFSFKLKNLIYLLALDSNPLRMKIRRSRSISIRKQFRLRLRNPAGMPEGRTGSGTVRSMTRSARRAGCESRTPTSEVLPRVPVPRHQIQTLQLGLPDAGGFQMEQPLELGLPRMGSIQTLDSVLELKMFEFVTRCDDWSIDQDFLIARTRYNSSAIPGLSSTFTPGTIYYLFLDGVTLYTLISTSGIPKSVSGTLTLKGVSSSERRIPEICRLTLLKNSRPENVLNRRRL